MPVSDDDERTEATGSGSRRRRPRRISDVDTLRALAHPTRIALLETFVIRGAMTATEASEHVGESPSSCSFHLRQLQRFGFVEEGRRRAHYRRLGGERWEAPRNREGEGSQAAELGAGKRGGAALHRHDCLCYGSSGLSVLRIVWAVWATESLCYELAAVRKDRLRVVGLAAVRWGRLGLGMGNS